MPVDALVAAPHLSPCSFHAVLPVGAQSVACGPHCGAQFSSAEAWHCSARSMQPDLCLLAQYLACAPGLRSLFAGHPLRCRTPSTQSQERCLSVLDTVACAPGLRCPPMQTPAARRGKAACASGAAPGAAGALLLCCRRRRAGSARRSCACSKPCRVLCGGARGGCGTDGR